MRLDRTHSYAPGDVNAGAGPGSTTQVAVIDGRGDAVALTCTIEQEYGSAVVAPGTGFLLNNELTDFGTPGTANAAAPVKRPRSGGRRTSVARAFVGLTGLLTLHPGGGGVALICRGVGEPVLNRLEFG